MPAVLAIFNEPIMSWFSPPGLAGTPHTARSWSGLETIKVQSGSWNDAMALLEMDQQ